MIEYLPYYVLQKLSSKIHMPALITHFVGYKLKIKFKTDQQENIADEKHATPANSRPSHQMK